MGLLEDCKTYFGSSSLYGVLQIEKNAAESEIKKAYRKASLLCHPDRADKQDKEVATRKFQTLSKVHNILSDEEKRKVYDDTGSVDEENFEADKDWMDYWRLLFPKLTKKDIDDYMNKYKGSDEEIQDLKRCYCDYEGDMDKISEVFIGYSIDEEDKYREILLDLIERDEIPSFPKFTNENKKKRESRRKRFKKEAKEAEVAEDSLVSALMKNAANRKSNFDDMISRMEEKYGSKKSSTKRKNK